MEQHEQRSDDWHKWRSKGIGSSEISTVIGKNPYQTPYQLWRIKTGLDEAPDLSDNFFVKRGVLLEPKARSLVNEELKSNFVERLFVDKDYDFCRYSSDGFDEARNEIIEIKCMNVKNHEKVLETNAPIDYYIPQCQYGMRISGATKCLFVSYCQEHPEPIKIIEIESDKTYQDMLYEKASEFWNMVLTKSPPDLDPENDFIDVTCNQWNRLVDRYKISIQKLKEAETEVDFIKEEIKKFANKRNVKGHGIKAFTSYRKGAVDYSKIEALKSVDLEKYRKKDSEIFYIKAD